MDRLTKTICTVLLTFVMAPSAFGGIMGTGGPESSINGQIGNANSALSVETEAIMAVILTVFTGNLG